MIYDSTIQVMIRFRIKILTNFGAHLCAQHASSTLATFVWFVPPSFLQQYLQFAI